VEKNPIARFQFAFTVSPVPYWTRGRWVPGAKGSGFFASFIAVFEFRIWLDQSR
jgi:hypothetical protein